MKVLQVLLSVASISTLLCLPMSISALESSASSSGHDNNGASVPAAAASTRSTSSSTAASLRGAQRRSLQGSLLPSPYDGVCYAGYYEYMNGNYVLFHAPTNCTTAFLSHCGPQRLCSHSTANAYEAGSFFQNFSYYPTNVTNCEYKLMICSID